MIPTQNTIGCQLSEMLYGSRNRVQECSVTKRGDESVWYAMATLTGLWNRISPQ